MARSPTAAARSRLTDVGTRRMSPSPANGPLSLAGRLGVLGCNARLFATTLACGAAVAVAGWIAPVRGTVDGSVYDNALAGFAMPAPLAVTFAVSALIAVPFTLSALVLRCHDRGHSGWWLLLALVPLVGALFLLYLLVWPASPTPNAYGPQRPATPIDKLAGILGLVLAVASVAGAGMAWRGLADALGPAIRGVDDPNGLPADTPASGPLDVR